MPQQFKHPPMFEDVGSVVPTEQVNKRLRQVFDALPRLWTDYAAQVLPYVDQESLDEATLRDMLLKLSLRPEAFLEWDQAYFDEQFDGIVEQARERGSHPY